MEKKPMQPTVRIPMIALRGLVLYPKMVLHFDIGRSKSIKALKDAMENDRKVFLITQRDIREDDPSINDLHNIGVVGEVRQIIRGSRGENGAVRVMVEGVYRAKIDNIAASEPYLLADVRRVDMREVRGKQRETCQALMRLVKDSFEEYCYLSTKVPKELVLTAIVEEDPNQLAEYIAGNIPISIEDKQSILEENSVAARLEYLMKVLKSENELLGIEREIHDKVREQIDKNQRDYYLREQIKAINSELGEGDSPQDDAEAYRKRIDALVLPDETREKFLSEADRLSRMSAGSHEGGVIRNYLDTCLALPWGVATQDKIDIAAAKRIFDADHYGLEKVKDRILEMLAVKALSPDLKAQIICLVGPPGVGKTSIAKSIAKAIGRKYVRMSLGGVRDESDIRGHRKTYIGAMPGRIANALKLSGSMNPLMLLDEVDKLGNDFKGDPSSALLEVLDPEQNNAFRDHYLEVPLDLSRVLFIATANDASQIPGPLYDRMEIINLSSYTREEKFQIAKMHLAAKQRERNGLNGRMLRLEDSALYSLIDYYTRESGVRGLERNIASLCRKAAKEIVAGEKKRVVINEGNITDYLGPHKYKPDRLADKSEIGIANGLAWTSVGGEMMQIEIAIMNGTGKIELTGSLGNVMKESAQAAVSYIRSNAERYQIDPAFYNTKDIHVHVPEGAVPKDGPSAGITICTALISALSGVPVRNTVAMTGEMSLRGRVLPIGGLKEKTMAAYRSGIRTIIIPKDNEPDLYEVDNIVKQAVSFEAVERIESVIDKALEIVTDNKEDIADAGKESMPIDPALAADNIRISAWEA